jgi:hypothetical protein
MPHLKADALFTDPVGLAILRAVLGPPHGKPVRWQVVEIAGRRRSKLPPEQVPPTHPRDRATTIRKKVSGL